MIPWIAVSSGDRPEPNVVCLLADDHELTLGCWDGQGWYAEGHLPEDWVPTHFCEIVGP